MRKFKGWTIPGHDIPEGAREVQPEPGETIDIISGEYRIYQLKDGHRFSTDDVLVAWYATENSPQANRMLDLGSGIGSVALMVAWRRPRTKIVTVEAQDISMACARKSWALNGLSEWVDLRHGDFRSPDVFREEEERSFDLITGSPPYFPLDSGLLGDHPQKVACRFEVRGDIADYCKTASRMLKPGGGFACVFPIDPPHQLDRVWKAVAESGLRVVQWRPIELKAGETPLLGVFWMMHADDLPEGLETWREPPLRIREKDGKTSLEYRLVKLRMGFPPN
jgi:tRNA1Val (adenine37-N6)-methyltransferase